MALSPFILHITDFNIILFDATIAYMNEGWGQRFECKLFFECKNFEGRGGGKILVLHSQKTTCKDSYCYLLTRVHSHSATACTGCKYIVHAY